ncbi:transposase [uncultured Senegalimassilia sp.]|uniref:transposase n=1 Tax=uncultured Senegalimassilia sp. TaxID=1714350 RepID=UPI0026197D71|nr:transposase [uncultured Senegalimassilia sp.]
MAGIGPRTASKLVISIDIADFAGRDGLASRCGPAPRNRRSGTSISSASASRQGSKRPRNLLIFSCDCPARSRNRWGEYHARCRDRGLPHGKALKAVARKRLEVIYAIMGDKVPYAA